MLRTATVKLMTEFYIKVFRDHEEFRIEEGQFPEVYLTQPAENGRANSELLRRLEERLNKRPAIVSGHQSKRKKLIKDMEQEEIQEKLFN